MCIHCLPPFLPPRLLPGEGIYKENLFWLTVSEISVQVWLDPLVWAYDEEEYYDSGRVWQRLLTSWQQKTERERQEGARARYTL
jgi:hypothetical protein